MLNVRDGEDDPVFVRYRADIWVEVGPDGEIVAAVVESATMETPIEVLRLDGSPIGGAERADAIDAAGRGLAVVELGDGRNSAPSRVTNPLRNSRCSMEAR